MMIFIAFTKITPAATPNLLRIALSPQMGVLNTRGTKHTWTRESVDAQWESVVGLFIRALEERGYKVNQAWSAGAFFFAPEAQRPRVIG